MMAEKGEGAFKLLLESIDPENANEICEIIQKLLGVGRGQANDIIDSVPIVLLDEVSDEEKANRIKQKFEEAEKLGAKLKITSEELEDIPMLRWPEEPDIARDGDDSKGESRDEDILTLVKYNFTVDRRNVFRCPHCDKLFMISELTAEDTMEARAQADIAERLARKKEQDVVESVPEAPISPVQEGGVMEMEPMQEVAPKSDVISASEPMVMDLATFEEGLSSIEYEPAEAPELALPPDVEEVALQKPEADQDFFKELESLPVEGQTEAEDVVEIASDEAVQKESELEELGPEEAMKFFEERRDPGEGEGDEEDVENDEEEGKKKIVAPRRGAARKRMQRLRDKQEDKEGGKRKGSGRRRKVREEPEEEEDLPEIEHTEGYHGVVLSRIGSRDKKIKAAKLIVEIAGAHPEEARDMVEGTFVNVLRGISEEEANEVAAKFKDIGVSAKVTLQKRKMKKSGRVSKGSR